MTVRANAIRVAVIQREERVIGGRQRRRKPGRGGVARRAGSGPSSGAVIRIRGAGKVGFVARIAVGRRSRKYIVDVALVASHIGVRAS